MPDIYIKVDGIPGEATEEKHVGWGVALSLNWGASQPHATASAGGGARGGISRCEHQDLVITKYLDKMTPPLNLHCCNGKRIPKITIDICRQVDTKLVYMQYELEGALVRSTSIYADGSGSDEKPTEEVAFAYEKITQKYTEVDAKTNKPAGDTMTWADLVSNTYG